MDQQGSIIANLVRVRTATSAARRRTESQRKALEEARRERDNLVARVVSLTRLVQDYEGKLAEQLGTMEAALADGPPCEEVAGAVATARKVLANLRRRLEGSR